MIPCQSQIPSLRITYASPMTQSYHLLPTTPVSRTMYSSSSGLSLSLTHGGSSSSIGSSTTCVDSENDVEAETDGEGEGEGDENEVREGTDSKLLKEARDTGKSSVRPTLRHMPTWVGVRDLNRSCDLSRSNSGDESQEIKENQPSPSNWDKVKTVAWWSRRGTINSKSNIPIKPESSDPYQTNTLIDKQIVQKQLYPTITRPLKIDLSNLSPFPTSEFGQFQFSYHSGTTPTPETETDENGSKPITFQRAGTPLDIPQIPRLDLRRSIPILPITEEDDSPPPTPFIEESNSLPLEPLSFKATPPPAPRCIPLPLPSVTTVDVTGPIKTVENHSSAIDISCEFDLDDLFSPRATELSAPLLQAVQMDAYPPSPLELPRPSRLGLSFDVDCSPTRKSGSMTIIDRRISTGSFKQSTRSTFTSISSILECPENAPPKISQTLLTKTSELGLSSSTITPSSDQAKSGISIPPQSKDSPIQSPTQQSKPRTIPTPSRNSSPQTFHANPESNRTLRRHSSLIRPSILPSKTPPSLIISPRTLGTSRIPPLISPTSPATSTLGIDRRMSIRSRRNLGMGSLGSCSYGGIPGSGSGLGLGMRDSITGIGGVDRHGLVNGIEGLPRASKACDMSGGRVATPGTFGLQGEADRLAREGLNPYFS